MKTNCLKSIFLCFVASSVLFFALPAAAQESGLQVKCVDASGAPVSGVKVAITSLKNPQKPKDKKSDGQGVAEFTKLEDGAYRVVGRKEGSVPAFYEFAMLNKSQASVTLKFEPGADKKLWFEDPAEEQKAKALVKQGLEAAGQKKFPEAENLFKQALAVKPSYAEAYYYIAMATMEQGKYEEAIQILEKASELANIWLTVPGPDANAFQLIVQKTQETKKNLPGLKAENAYAQKNWELAIKLYSEAIQSSPNNADYYAKTAASLYNLQRYDEALVAVDKAVQLQPQTYDKVRATILAKKENQKIEKANGTLQEGIKLLQSGDAAAALQKFEEAKGMVPADVQAPIWKQIGVAQTKLDKPEAEESFKKAIELAPAGKPERLLEYKNALAGYYVDKGKFDQGIEIMVDSKAENPEKALIELAKTSINKQPKLAVAALERVLKMNPENVDAAFELGQQFYLDKNNARAKELLTKYVEKGKDQEMLGKAKDMLILLERRLSKK